MANSKEMLTLDGNSEVATTLENREIEEWSAPPPSTILGAVCKYLQFKDIDVTSHKYA